MYVCVCELTLLPTIAFISVQSPGLLLYNNEIPGLDKEHWSSLIDNESNEDTVLPQFRIE